MGDTAFGAESRTIAGMQLIKKLFGRPPGAGPGPESAQFHESEQTTTESGSRNAPRRELVQVVLRDTMRRHGIPSAWIDCRILSVVNRNSRTGMHVELIVREGIDRLLTYVPAFQGSFMTEIVRFDPRVDDWLFSLSWHFPNLGEYTGTVMPDPAVWAGTTAAAALMPASPRAPTPTPAPAPVVRTRPAALAPSPVPIHKTAPIAVPKTATPASTPPVRQAVADPVADDEVQEDLQALYAIRDAALGHAPAIPRGPSGERDFESTHPGADDSAAPAGPGQPRRW